MYLLFTFFLWDNIWALFQYKSATLPVYEYPL